MMGMFKDHKLELRIVKLETEMRNLMSIVKRLLNEKEKEEVK